MPGERSSHPVRLSAEQRARVRAEVTRSPDGLTRPFAAGNGRLLSQHLRSNLGIELSARQCRRLLRVFGVAAAPTYRNPPPSAAAEAVHVLQSEPFPNAAALARRPSAGPELVLRKIRRLASSGLPPYPFVLTLFDLIAEAIPAGDLTRGILTDPASELSWVFVNLDQARWVPILANLIGDDPTAWPGLRPRTLRARRAGRLLSHISHFGDEAVSSGRFAIAGCGCSAHRARPADSETARGTTWAAR